MDDWRRPAEIWLFVSPHDDDIVLGGGLVFQAGITEDAEVHAAVVTDGRMGYCRIDQRDSITAIRTEEARQSFAVLGLAPERLYFLGYPDGHLSTCTGAFIGTASRDMHDPKRPSACKSPSRGSCGRCGPRGSSCQPVPICIRTIALSTNS